MLLLVVKKNQLHRVVCESRLLVRFHLSLECKKSNMIYWLLRLGTRTLHYRQDCPQGNSGI